MFYIYVIQNKINHKLYVGKAAKPLLRFAEHKSIANGAKPKEFSLIHMALKKYGVDNFTHQIIEEWENEQDAYEAEEFWIDFFRSCNKKFGKDAGYNVDPGGKGTGSGPFNPMFGKSHTPETLAKMSLKQSGDQNPNFGKHWSEEIKDVMSAKKQGIYLGENNPRAKLTNLQAQEIKIKYETGNYSTSELADEYGVARKVIWKIVTNQTYKG